MNMVPLNSSDNGLVEIRARPGTKSAEHKRLLHVPLFTVALSIYRSHQTPFTHTCYLPLRLSQTNPILLPHPSSSGLNMKLHALLLALPLLAAANPLAAPEPEAVAEPIPEPAPARAGSSGAGAAALSPRACALTGSNVRYRKCPSTNSKKCPAVGEYGAKGTKVSFKCWTTGSTVNGNE